jgi:hypothetical protein
VCNCSDTCQYLFCMHTRSAVTSTGSDVLQKDDAFAAQRVSGVNPLCISALHQRDPRASIVHRIKHHALRKRAKQALKSGQVFIADYSGGDPRYKAPSLVKVRLQRMRACTP